ncbi:MULTISPECIES: hypothetical protein [Microbacterium]|uniref:hypothetical protein n=1 Tax=Microbacterium TaxID=33882 RepID=UPI0010F6E2F9|nr:hypothetical protein [Microbacterium sp. 4NA327F11]
MRATRQPITDADEARIASEMAQRLSYVDTVLDRHAAISERTPAPWSQLGSDDAASKWMQVSHQLNAMLGMSADNLRVVRGMLHEDGELVVPMYGHYPVLRSAIEASALAKWIAEPDDQAERLRRSFSARIADLNEDRDLHAEAMKAAALHAGVELSLLKRGDDAFKLGDAKARAEIRGICLDRHIPWTGVSKGLPGYASIVRAVGSAGDVPGNYAASIWRIISGLSHPSASRATRYSALEILGESKDGVLRARVSASMNWTQAALSVATTLTLDALRLVELRLDSKHPRRSSAFGSVPAT